MRESKHAGRDFDSNTELERYYTAILCTFLKFTSFVFAIKKS